MFSAEYVKYLLFLIFSINGVYSRTNPFDDLPVPSLKPEDIVAIAVPQVNDSALPIFPLLRPTPNPNITLSDELPLTPESIFIKWEYETAAGEKGVLDVRHIKQHHKKFAIVKKRNCQQCHCGKPYNQRIVGGVLAAKHEFPWMVLLRYGRSFYCGGTLINDRYVATAAHCTKGFSAGRVSMQFMKYKQHSTEIGEITRKAHIIYRPTGYSQSTLDQDISLIKLNEAVQFGTFLKPICLPSFDMQFEGLIGLSAGWGTTSEGGSVSDVLRKVEVPFIGLTECRNSKYGNRITSNMQCAGYSAGGKDSCQGDSGGPLMVSIRNTYHLAGVTSWGIGCARQGYPGVYARVPRFVNSIKILSSDACSCF